MSHELVVTIKDGPKYQLPTPQYDKETPLIRAATTKGEFDPCKVKPRPGWVWGKILPIFLPIPEGLVRPQNAKATVRHWIETADGRKLIFEYARGELVRIGDEEWLAVREEHILAEQVAHSTLLMMNKSILLKVDPLPTQTGALYDPSARQVQAEIGTVQAHDCHDLGINNGDRIAFIATAGTYCVINGKEYRLIHRDQAMGVLYKEEHMGKFRKKPVVIEAVLARDAIRAATGDWQALPQWLRTHYGNGGVVFTDEGVHLPTLEGTMLARPEDWILCGVKGEIYPCKPDIFEATYEPAS